MHLQIISKYYRKMNATLGHDQRLEFESDHNLIRLDIPPEGITTSDEAWRITALGSSVVCTAVATSLTRLHTPTVLIGVDYRFCCICVGSGVHIYVEHFFQIERKEVDNFEKGKRIPSCQLMATCKTERPTTLEHLVTLSGAKYPHNTFTIYRPYDSGTY